MEAQAQIKLIKKYLQMNMKLTVKKAQELGCGTELRSKVCQIREKDNWHIVSKRVPGEHYHEYWLAND